VIKTALILLALPVLLGVWPVSSVMAENTDTAKVQAAGAGSEGSLPDAMQHLPKGPEINFEALRDPFSSFLAEAAVRASMNRLHRASTLTSRQREPLESYDLSALKLVAIYSMGEERVAMLEDTTGKGFTVRRGNHLGKNNGRINQISPYSLVLTERVFDPAGDIVDRKVTMTLKEVNQSGSGK